jgi:hypothetical protein
MTVLTGQDAEHLIAVASEGVALVFDCQAEARDVELHFLDEPRVGNCLPSVGVLRNGDAGQVGGSCLPATAVSDKGHAFLAFLWSNVVSRERSSGSWLSSASGNTDQSP